MNTKRILTIALLLLLFARLTSGARELSFTSDEPSHIATGYAFIARGSVWTVPLRGHPPLLDAWLALPVYIGSPDIPLESLSGWQEDNTRYVQAFVPFLREEVSRMEVAARVPAILLSVLLAAVVARWAQSLVGLRGSWIGLLVLVSDPTLLAHGMLATNDVGVVALGTLGLFLTFRLLQRPTATRIGLTGIVLGLALLAKGSGIIWLAGALLMIASTLVRGAPRRNSIGRTLVLCAAVTVVALLCVWVSYGFEWGLMDVGGLSLPVPAPTHWKSILAQSGGAESRWTYFLGQVRQGGSWLYFPVSGLIKNPIPWLVLGLWGLLGRFGRQRRIASPAGTWIFPVLYFVTAIWSGVNIGYRHMLPLHPFVYLLVASIPLRKPHAIVSGSLLIAWLTIESLFTAPYYLSYFSPVVGGAEQGWRYLADSNTDWGQGYRSLRRYQVENDGASSVRYSGPEGYIGLNTYDIRYEALPPVHSNPEPILKPYLYPDAGPYVISANSLSGLGSVAPDNYAWFRYHETTAVVADALFYYQVPPLPSDTWLGQCSVPVVPLKPATIAEGFPVPPSRQIAFDCTQAWIYPGPDTQLGWYALHQQVVDAGNPPAQRIGLKQPEAQQAFVTRRIGNLAVSYRQWDYRDTPAFILFEWTEGQALELPPRRTVHVAVAGTPPDALPSSSALPVEFAGPLTLVDIRAYREGDSVEVETWWIATESAITAPLSVMAHLVAGDGSNIAVADGFAVSTMELQSGDIVVQSHTFVLADDAEGVWFRTGAYWLDTTELWSAADGSGNAIHISLDEALTE